MVIEVMAVDCGLQVSLKVATSCGVSLVYAVYESGSGLS